MRHSKQPWIYAGCSADKTFAKDSACSLGLIRFLPKAHPFGAASTSLPSQWIRPSYSVSTGWLFSDLVYLRWIPSDYFYFFGLRCFYGAAGPYGSTGVVALAPLENLIVTLDQSSASCPPRRVTIANDFVADGRFGASVATMYRTAKRPRMIPLSGNVWPR
jgi:hypothetical protein